jgi:hypothetical protein
MSSERDYADSDGHDDYRATAVEIATQNFLCRRTWLEKGICEMDNMSKDRTC